MRKFTLALAALFLASLTVTGQTSDEELARLRNRLNVAESTLIITSKSSKLPAGSSLKIYIATGQDRKAHNRFAKWIDKWNQKDGKQYGSLQIVSDVTQADVILARYTVRGDVSIERRTSIGVGPVRDPATMRTSTKPIVSTRAYIPLPLYSYLITRTPDALLIVYRDVDRSHIEDHRDPDGSLMNDLKQRLKTR